MNYQKRIVFDYDDTIAIPENRDWINAEPNTKIIEKINDLYDQGWRIDIFTARGSISCKTRDEAKDKYEEGIVKWLDKHGVKYHELSFNKPLAAYYVDDKALTPEAFQNLEIRNLTGGLSGNDIYTDGIEVHKTAKNSHEVSWWYFVVRHVINVPKVYRIVGDTISLEYIPHDPDYFKNKFHLSIGMIQDTLQRLKTRKLPHNDLEYDSYIKRIADHIELSGIESLNKVLYFLKKIHLEPTFAHGDFGITNMLFAKDGSKLTLIDPIPDTFGCCALDAAKFVASLYVNKYEQHYIDQSIGAMELFNNMNDEGFRTLIAAELIRIIKYHNDPNFITKCIEDVLKSN
jgi:capsule biosynthesis phosphatase